MITKSNTQPLTVKANKEKFATKLMSLEKYYHINHPMHEMMHAGKCTQEQLQGWVLNRFYYQVAIPRKDAFILAASHDKNFRRIWRQRIIDHDGDGVDGGGIEAWLALGEACGLKRQDVESCEHVLPGVRFAVDAYVNFVRHAPWQESVCSSLTELFAPKIHQQRLSNWPKNYPFVEEKGFTYFRKRLTEARRDVEHGLDIVLNEFDTLEKQNRALCILQFKLDVLWSMADAIYLAYIINEPPYHSVN